MTKKLDKLLGEPSKEPVPSADPAGASPSEKVKPAPAAKPAKAKKPAAPPKNELRDKMTQGKEPKNDDPKGRSRSLWNPGSWGW